MFKQFISEEEGSLSMEYLAILCVMAGLAGIAYSMTDKGKEVITSFFIFLK